MWPVLVCAVFVYILFLWKEYRLAGVRRFFLTSFVSLVAIVSLVIMVLQPLQLKDRATGVGVILTQNYKEAQLDSLKLEYDGLSLISYTGNGFEKAHLDSINRAYIIGNGVAAYDFWQLENIGATYLGSDKLRGIVRLNYDRELTQGDSLRVNGLYAKPILGNKLILEDPGGNALDSVVFLQTKNLKFSLDTKPKISGRFVYKLVEKDTTNTIISSDPLPVVIKPKSTLSILIINTFPTFETKYLKNFLAENGHGVLVRSQLTKNTFKFENFNRKQGAVYNFSQSNLSEFDLVIIDIGSYLGLSRASRRALERQMRDEGLGVFIQPDASLVNIGKRLGFRLKRNTTTEIALPQWPKVKIPVLAASFEPEVLSQPILSSPDRVLSAYKTKGEGRLSTSMLTDTYQLVLDGEEATYQYVWSTILSAVSQKNLPIVQWETGDYMAYKDEPFRFGIRTRVPNPQVLDGMEDRIPLRQNIQLSDQWEGVVYPRMRGWNELHLAQDSTATKDYYVTSKTDWQQLKAYNLKQENRRAFTGTQPSQAVISVLKPISRLWFFVVFVLAMGYLWFVPRIEV